MISADLKSGNISSFYS